MMIKESQAIEVEVVEIDGAAPPPAVSPYRQEEAAPEARGQRSWQDWQQWQGRVRKLDSRWWPLWVFLGFIAIVLMLTVGVVLGIIFAIFKMVSSVLRALFR